MVKQLDLSLGTPLSLLQEEVDRCYSDTFGRTPLSERLSDIKGEVTELLRYTDIRGLREEAGDALTSIIQLANEAGWSVEDLIRENLDKVRSRQEHYRAHGRKKKVAILGGAFNPVTLGHVSIAEFVLGSGIFDEVWLMPCYDHTGGKVLAPAEDRLAMCKLATKNPKIKVFDYEIEKRLSGETYNLVKRLLEEDYAKSKYSFSFVIGADNANSFHTWAGHRELERMMRFVVVQRAGVAIDPNATWYLKDPHVFLKDGCPTHSPISSTMVRQWLKDKAGNAAELAANMPGEVLAYIEQKELYL